MTTWILNVFVVLFAFYLFLGVLGDNRGTNAFVYGRHELLDLRPPADQRTCIVDADIPAEIVCKPRKRGKRGGVRRRNRRRWRHVPLPSIIMGNVRSINNKIDELPAPNTATRTANPPLCASPKHGSEMTSPMDV